MPFPISFSCMHDDFMEKNLLFWSTINISFQFFQNQVWCSIFVFCCLSPISFSCKSISIDFRMLTAIQASELRLFSSSRTFYINTAARWRLWWSQFDYNMYLGSHAISFILFSFQQNIPERSNQLFYNLTSYTIYEKAHAWIFLWE